MDNVKNRWIEQEIWDDEWNEHGVGGRWKHEKLPEPPREPSPVFSWFEVPRVSVPDQLRVVSEEQMIAHERETAASRPYHQFRYQVLKEREWIEDEPISDTIDIDAKAYEDVKARWIEQKIWDSRWGDMPGMTLIHEEPFEEDAQISADTGTISFVGAPYDVARANSRNKNFVAGHSISRLSSPAVNGGNGQSSNKSETSKSASRESSAAGSKRHTILLPMALQKAWAQTAPDDQILNGLRAPGVQERGELTVQAAPPLQRRLDRNAAEPTKARQRPKGIQGMHQMLISSPESSRNTSQPLHQTMDLDEDKLTLSKLPRRSARIRARSGTSRSSKYDTLEPAACTKRHGSEEQQQQQTGHNKKRLKILEGVNPRKPKRRSKNKPQRQNTCRLSNDRPT
jgi:hypothetical protein